MYENETLLFKYNVDENGNPRNIKVDKEQKQVSINGTIQMEFLPSESNTIVVLDDKNKEMYEVFNRDEIVTNSYYVDYSSGTLYFDKSQFGKVKIYNYYNKGFQMIGASRIYDEKSITGELIAKTLQNIIDEGRRALELISTLGDAVIIINKLEENISTGTILHDNLSNDIEIGTPLQLILRKDIDEAKTFKDTFHQDVADGKILSPELRNNIIEGENTNAKLIQTKAEAKADIEKINSTGNKSLIIGGSQFTNNEYTWTHNMSNDNLIVNFVDSATNEPLMPDYKIIDKNNILVRNSVEHSNVKVILSASYYQGNSLFGTNIEEFAGDSITPNAKKVRLKDGNGIVENPITDSNAVFMQDGNTRLTDYLNDMSDEIGSKLEEKIDKISIVNNVTGGGATKVLSAEQGKSLDGKITTANGRIDTVDGRVTSLGTTLRSELVAKTLIKNDLTTGGSSNVLSAEQGKVLNTNINTQKGRIDKFFGTTIVMSELGNPSDWGAKLNSLMTEKIDYTIICESNKEYVFTTKINIQAKIKIVGNDSIWRWNGTGVFFDFLESTWQVEGSVIDDLVIWAGVKSEGAYQVNRVCFNIQGGHITIKFRNLKIYNFGYVWRMRGNGTYKTFGHSILDCNVWGFITVVDSQGNSEQILIQHCWLDDGKRESGSTNACIKVMDATSFWIRDNTIQNCDIGISFRGVRSGEITGNHFENMIDSSIYLLPNSVYENRNTTIMGNWLVGHKAGIRFMQASTGNKTIHTTIIGNCFGFVGADAPACITASASDSQSNTVAINNSKMDGTKPWFFNVTTLKEFQ